MLNLEQSIADWRKQMLAAGIKTPVPLEELEIHLREEIERQIKLGLNEQKAFEISIQQIGQPKMLKSEFNKSERTFMKRTLIVLVGIFGVLCGAAFILPALAWYRDHGAMPADHLAPLLLGAVIVIAGLSTTIYGCKQRKA
jgi:hypothetical protein